MDIRERKPIFSPFIAESWRRKMDYSKKRWPRNEANQPSRSSNNWFCMGKLKDTKAKKAVIRSI